MNKKKKLGIFIILLCLISIILILVVNYRSFYNNKEISNKELLDIEDYLNSVKNNGFINHFYNNPLEIDISKVLYNDTSIVNKIYNTDKEYNAIKNKININMNDDIIGDLFKFDRLSIKLLYFEKTGKDISENINGIDLPYCDEYDFYWINHTDSHYTKIKCISGEIDENKMYQIVYQKEDSDKKYKVVLKKNKMQFLFVSNLEY